MALAFVSGAGWSVAAGPAAPATRTVLPSLEVSTPQTRPLLSKSSCLALVAAVVAAGGRRHRRRQARVSLRYTSMCKETDAPDSVRRRFEAIVAEAQEQICSTIERLDGKATFCREVHSRPAGGGGVARVLANGDIFEKAGCNLSVVYGEMPQEALKAASESGFDRAGVPLAPGQKVPFFACGLSSVMHPRNPFCPTMHFNYRYFATETGTWWFGGGTDITPSYLDEDDMRHFHGTYKKVCDQHNPEWYPKFKAWADEYFLIKHRGETRGLGGIFFDDFNTQPVEEHMQFAERCLKAVTEAYCPILEKHRNDSFTPEQKAWQQLRRGRYAEFNLVYDRGTIFGLKMLPSGVGRIESILMSLPETARWEYCHEPAPGSPEAKVLEVFKHPREWA